jgi:hypothetical protein
MPEIAALQESLEQVREALAEQNALTAAQNRALAEQTAKLAEVEEKLPGFVQRTGLRWAVSALVVGGLMVVALVLVLRSADAATERRFRAEAVATDRAFCDLTNLTDVEINRNRQALREAFNLLRPAPGSDPAAAARLDKFRQDLLATIDGDIPPLDCSGIGNGELDFSIQDAITGRTTTTTRP